MIPNKFLNVSLSSVKSNVFLGSVESNVSFGSVKLNAKPKVLFKVLSESHDCNL